MSQSKDKRSVRSALLGSLMLIAIAGCNQHPSVSALVADAQQYKQKGDKKAAIIQLKNAMQQEPNNAEVRMQLAVIYNESNDPVSAEKEVRKAMSLGLPATRTLPGLGQALLAQGKYQQVLDETQGQAKSDDGSLAVTRGRAYMGLNDADHAQAEFEQALKAKANDPDALIGLARLALAKNNLDVGTRYVDQAISNNPQSATALLAKGELLRSQGESDAALSVYDKILKLRPNDPLAHILKADLEVNNRNYDAARADIDNVRQSKNAPLPVFYSQAKLDYSQGKPALAMESLQQALRLSPDHMPSLLLAGIVQFTLGSMPQAEEYLRKYVDKNPNGVEGRKWLSRALAKDRQIAASDEMLIPALKARPADAELLVIAGGNAMQMEKFADASAYFTRAIAAAPKMSAPHTGLGLSSLAQGNNKLALSELELASDLDQHSVQGGVTLLMAQIRLRDFDAAMIQVKKFQQASPNNPVFAKLEGDIYVEQSNVAMARSSYSRAATLEAAYFPAEESLARLDIADGKPADAKKRYLDVLEHDKNSIPAMLALADLAISQGLAPEATSWLERAHTQAPDSVPVTVLLANRYLASGENKKALTLATSMQLLHNKDRYLLDLLGRAQFANGDKAAALETYNALATVTPASSAVQVRIAQLYGAMGNQPASLAALKKALALNPGDMNAQGGLAAIAIHNNNFEEATAIALEAQKKQPTSPDGYLFEGDLLLLQKKPAFAVKSYERAAALKPSSYVMIKIHDALRKAGKEPEANSRISAWLKTNPNDLAVRMYLGGVALASHDDKVAIAHFENALHQSPDNPLVLNNLAWAYQEQKDPRALPLAEKAYRVAGNSPSIIDTLGWILLEQGNTGRALPLLKKANQLDPQSESIHFHLAACMAKVGDKTGARKELQDLLAAKDGKDPGTIAAARTLLGQL